MKQIPPSQHSASTGKRRRGIALITVVSVLALMTLLTVAMFSMSQTELASSNQQTYQERSRELADSAVNVVMDQVWQGTRRKDDTANGRRYLWASQPGAVRRYQTDGTFDSGFKLYSSSQMVVRTDERSMVTDRPPADWNARPTRYVDLNEPVIRPAADAVGTPHLFFPILDPRAYVRTTEGAAKNDNIEGFYYSAGVNGVKDPDPNASIDHLEARLPMPVEWLYVLKDGTFGVLNGSNQFVKPDGSVLSPTEAKANPISGRVAFWTDDESCKLNINTASEPTYWTVPSLFHDRDLWWAYYQPTAQEYQRYPGHPATVALSTVFFPNQEMDLYGLPGSDLNYATILKRKETIYKLAPKINFGGSKAGTVPYWKFVDNYTGTGGTFKDSLYNKYMSLVDSIQERLYASVDELYFADGFENGRRKLSSYVNGSDGVTTNDSIFSRPGEISTTDKVNLERLRFFLTAQSRMPETNIFGTPRVAIWPVADEGGLEYEAGKAVLGVTNAKDFRTGFDQLIAFCASMGKAKSDGSDSYFFRRKCAYSPSRDIELQRNKHLIRYLIALLEQKFPGGASFKDKYPQDYKQVLVEIFDYIRATNLYDGFLAPSKETLQAASGAYDTAKYATTAGMTSGLKESGYDGFFYAERPKTFRTYTYDRASTATTRGATGQAYSERLIESSFPGHGMVAPSLYKDGAETYVGFGRFVALSEVGFQFICTADGATDKGSYVTPVADGATNWREPAVGDPARKVSGGRTAVRMTRYDPPNGVDEFAGPALTNNPKDRWLQVPKYTFWYSNYPPKPSLATMVNSYGVDRNAEGSKANSPYNHPGCLPENWNGTLDIGSAPLQPTQRRVQGMLVMKFSMPAPGFSLMNPEFTVKVEGLKNMQLAGMDLYDKVGAAEFEWKSNNEFFNAQDSRQFGGAASSYAMTFNRRVGSKTPGVISDSKYVSAGGGRTTGVAPAPHFGTRNLDLTTRFLTVTSVD
ncbi:MAG: Verru_Chthon cassette protein A, partial [Verrucomicrobium sp.]